MDKPEEDGPGDEPVVQDQPDDDVEGKTPPPGTAPDPRVLEDPTGLTTPAVVAPAETGDGGPSAGPWPQVASEEAAVAEELQVEPASSGGLQGGTLPGGSGAETGAPEASAATATVESSLDEAFHVEPAEPAARAEGAAVDSAAAPGEEAAVDASAPADDPPFHVEPPDAASSTASPDVPSGAPAADPGAPGDEPVDLRDADAATAAPRPARPLPRIMAVANQKGGVGKTTTAVNLGAALAELGYRTLVVDLDPQGNATTGLGINARTLGASVYDVLMRELPVEDAVEPTSVRNLFVVPATIDLAGAEIELVPAFSRELRLKRALAGVADDFDFTLIDCPPSLGLLTVNALAAATEVVVPVQCEYYALEGLSALLRNVQLVQTNLNTALEMSTIILTMYDARTKLAEQVANEVRQHFGNVVCRHMVPRTVRLSEAPSFGQPIIVFDPSSRGAIAYRELAKEVSGGTPQRVG